jgi:hypothetical protein
MMKYCLRLRLIAIKAIMFAEYFTAVSTRKGSSCPYVVGIADEKCTFGIIVRNFKKLPEDQNERAV